MYKNLLEETNKCLEEHGLSWDEVEWIKVHDMEISIDNFKEVAAHTNYDSGFGHPYIDQSLQIVGTRWIMIRSEYDGSEWWEVVYTTRPWDRGTVDSLEW